MTDTAPEMPLIERTALECIALVKELRSRINSAELFHSAQDQQIAGAILDRLEACFDRGSINVISYKATLNALGAILPKRNERGYRQIANITITPLMEKTIQSRSSSEEVDITAPEGSWGSLPQQVKDEIVEHCGPIIEMTTNCTVRCSFCALSEKGPIQKKISYDSLKELLTYFRDNKPLPPLFYQQDLLYWGTDPFDIKWEAGGKELDYTDFAIDYWDNIMKNHNHYLYTSTAVPVGEELRVFKFADEFVRRKKMEKIKDVGFKDFRISVTKVNEERAYAICRILEALHDTPPYYYKFVEVTGNREKGDVVLAGKKFEKRKELVRIIDVVGVNSRDGVVIGAKGVDSIIMEAGSNERPRGVSQFRIKDEETGTYTIPHFQNMPDFRHARFPDIYPDAMVTKLWIQEGESNKVVEEIKNNPHRAFLRMVGIATKLILQYGNLDNVPSHDRYNFRDFLQRETQLVQSYLDLGADNNSMRIIMDFFRKKGLI